MSRIGLGLHAVAPVELEHVLHHPVEPARVVADDPDQALARGLPVLLAHQLGRVGDRRQRVADLVRDVGGEPAEGGEFQLARLVFQLGDVLEVDHREAVVPDAGVDEPRAHHRARFGKGQHRCCPPGAGAPIRQRLGELDRERLDLIELGRRPPEQLRDARIVAAHEAVRIDDEHPVLHVLDDALVDSELVGEIEAALPGDPLVGDHPLRELVGDERGGEVTDRDHRRWQEAPDVLAESDDLDRLLDQHRNGRERRVEQQQPAAAHERRRGDRDQQHHREAAAEPAAREHEQNRRGDVGADVGGEVGLEAPGRPLERHLKRDAAARYAAAATVKSRRSWLPRFRASP